MSIFDAQASSTSNSLLDKLGKLAGILALVSAYLFLAGYLFERAYYGFFGIHVIALDLPSYTFLVYSIVEFKVLFIVSIILAVLVAFDVHRKVAAISRRTGETVDQFLASSALGSLVLFLLLLPILFAKSDGEREARKFEQIAPRAHLSFKTVDKQQCDSKLSKANDEGQLRILAQTKELIILFKVEGKGVSTFVVPRSELVSLSIQP